MGRQDLGDGKWFWGESVRRYSDADTSRTQRRFAVAVAYCYGVTVTVTQRAWTRGRFSSGGASPIEAVGRLVARRSLPLGERNAVWGFPNCH